MQAVSAAMRATLSLDRHHPRQRAVQWPRLARRSPAVPPHRPPRLPRIPARHPPHPSPAYPTLPHSAGTHGTPTHVVQPIHPAHPTSPPPRHQSPDRPQRPSASPLSGAAASVSTCRLPLGCRFTTSHAHGSDHPHAAYPWGAASLPPHRRAPATSSLPQSTLAQVGQVAFGMAFGSIAATARARPQSA